ncbi:facilitated trehalose transporter Tret1 isoform X2 [Neodiprion pinetum]|uniref:facilitated trehalose transporter Tret1 isoform X2 n=1 Tax=Neodiprion pinetum TaxID=441929 RepID=UPI001EDCEF95|nr:facilitated trehalose transporter Tret1-like isoform X1 [Neodiprion pinetum]XP_046471596.1 facilitated trehalose transporter Tret1-like isoform X1 [Neodiprion pinetum]XP_046471598.1 facilitated trehalose transporter Tret1-like isoform X1 [Neodiprion pinetum]XP_046471599.1 facilitated trehalose transporter Tret1-like isoform X1 [Neodiprion pinetum]XP_046471600.1 facilitated trehalose transporter Tret1-like isoform X1 [Neodiprion pinetum]XP_046471601.1 facilitated trehalose transporter Tret1-
MFRRLWKTKWLLRPTEILWYQWIGGIGSMLMLGVIGMLIGMFSPLLAQMTSPNPSLFLTLDEASWVASLSSPARLVGAIFGSIGVHYLGGKRAMLIAGCPLLLAWVCLILADSAKWLYGTSFAHGLGIGIAFVSFPVYLGEVSSSATRGALVSFAVSGFPLGSLIGNVLGTYLPKTTFGYIALAPTIVYIAIFLCVPESPHYFVRMGKLDQAERAISRYHPKVVVEEELQSLQKFTSESNSITTGDRLRELITPRNRKAGVIILLLYFFMHFSGLNSIIYYMEIILKTSKVTAISPATVVVVANVLDSVGGWVAMSLADRYGRKPMWIISACGACVSMLLTGVNFTLLANGYNSHEQQWVPIICMISFRVFLFVGVFSLPSIFMSELIAPNVKGVVVCLANIFAGLVAFASTKSYQPLLDAFGEACVFYLYAVIMLLALIFGMTLPETKGKTLQEIQNM